MIYLAAAILIAKVGLAVYLLVEYGSAPVMSAYPTPIVVLMMASSGLQIFMACIGGAISVMAKQQSRAKASKRLIGWTLTVIGVDTLGTIAYAIM
jgi:hypothetical protein